MMTKNEAIQRVNEDLRANLLNERNTHWSTLAHHGSDEGWWLNIPYLSFRQELHFLLNNEKTKVFRHLRIKAGQILSPGTKFSSKDAGAEVFISAANPKRLVDILPGGSKLSFNKYVMGEYKF